MYREQSIEKHSIKNAFNEKQHKIFLKKIKLSLKELEANLEYEKNKMLYKLEYKEETFDRIAETRNNFIFTIVTVIAIFYIGLKCYKIRLKYLQNKKKNEAMDDVYNILLRTFCIWYFFWSLLTVVNNIFISFSFLDSFLRS